VLCREPLAIDYADLMIRQEVPPVWQTFVRRDLNWAGLAELSRSLCRELRSFGPLRTSSGIKTL
jgi:hypothetical protein